MNLNDSKGKGASEQPTENGPKALRRMRRSVALAVVALVAVGLLRTWWAETHPRAERRLRELVHDRLNEWFPHQMAPDDGWHGLHQQLKGSGERGGVRVLLIHGLDEPGTI